ncbi:MAG: hypothetical protein LCH69_13595 [Proteobacteria bacterium]|nr:hypothetical protein [Pseudomonadota bacterium]
MFDTQPDDHIAKPAPATAGWQSRLTHGDVVMFRYPVADGDGETPKPRPCLILDVVTIAGSTLVTLAYGTTACSSANRGYEIHVTRAEAMRAAGLHRPTRFVGARRITVTTGHPGFAENRAGTPVVGRLGELEFERLNAVRARIHAEADMAAERRATRRREGRQPPARPVSVEHRHPKRRATPASPRLAG